MYAVDEPDRTAFALMLPGPLLRCYADEGTIRARATENGMMPKEFIERVLFPDRGAVMSGDFGEFIGFFVQIAISEGAPGSCDCRMNTIDER